MGRSSPISGRFRCWSSADMGLLAVTEVQRPGRDPSLPATSPTQPRARSGRALARGPSLGPAAPALAGAARGGRRSSSPRGRTADTRALATTRRAFVREARRRPRHHAGDGALVPAPRAGARAAARSSRQSCAGPRAGAACDCAVHQIEYSRNAAAADGGCRGRCRSRAPRSGACRGTRERRAAPLRARARRTAARGRSHRSPCARRTRRGWSSGSSSVAAAGPASILDANNAHPPMVLRVDLSRIERGRRTSPSCASRISMPRRCSGRRRRSISTQSAWR